MLMKSLEQQKATVDKTMNSKAVKITIFVEKKIEADDRIRQSQTGKCAATKCDFSTAVHYIKFNFNKCYLLICVLLAYL